ncbi:hypothetical protein ACWD6I_14320, partial [Streptomyces sp. NPDC002454]
MSARRRGRAGRTWAGGAGLLALVGCGVQATDVIEAGGPATVYLCSEGYAPRREFGIHPLDPQLAIP